MSRNILIIGATSAIAQATARIYATQNMNILLVARHEARLIAVTQDLALRGTGKISYHVLDLTELTQHQLLIDHLNNSQSDIDIALIAHGSLPEQKNCENSFELALKELNTNYLSSISLLTHLSNYFEQKKRGSIAVITSVAGERGRQSNYLYGSAKGGLSIFLQGLGQRLKKSNVHVIDIKPGFVDTPMTKHFKKGFLWTSPEKVAQSIVSAINKEKSKVYIPYFWRYIMGIIKLIPDRIFNKMTL